MVMKVYQITFFFLLCCACTKSNSEITPQKQRMVEITEVSPDKHTALTKQNFFQLVQIYDLVPFLYTARIQIENDIPARSHPVLTLNTKYSDAPHKLLSQWLHQEFHWWANARPGDIRRAISQFKQLYPQVQVAEAESEKLAYLHFIINYLEYRGLEKYLGEKEALKVIRELMAEENHYRWVYGIVLSQTAAVKKIVTDNKLLPPVFD